MKSSFYPVLCFMLVKFHSAIILVNTHYPPTQQLFIFLLLIQFSDFFFFRFMTIVRSIHLPNRLVWLLVLCTFWICAVLFVFLVSFTSTNKQMEIKEKFDVWMDLKTSICKHLSGSSYHASLCKRGNLKVFLKKLLMLSNKTKHNIKCIIWILTALNSQYLCS